MYAELDTETKIRHAIDFVARRLPIPPALQEELGPDLTHLLENPDDAQQPDERCLLRHADPDTDVYGPRA